MEDPICISALNDFIFCPYSIYLHNVYMGADEDIYHATPQVKGQNVHRVIDNKKNSSKDVILALPVYSESLNIVGKIDMYKYSDRSLIERKYQLKHIYQGQIYQLWAQYFCMKEMGYIIDKVLFYETSINKIHPIDLPTDKDMMELMAFINDFRKYDPNESIIININKCSHCIYSNLCDKTDIDNVYQ